VREIDPVTAALQVASLLPAWRDFFIAPMAFSVFLSACLFAAAWRIGSRAG
jgi:hypothetical protein